MVDTSIAIQNIILVNMAFTRSPDIPNPLEYESQVTTEHQYSEDRKNLQVVLRTVIKEKSSEAVKIDCTMIGLFKLPDEISLGYETFATVNAPALIFPFLREIIGTTTLKAGIPPLFLPTFNFKQPDQMQEQSAH